MAESVVDVGVDVVVWETVFLGLCEWGEGVFEPLLVVVVVDAVALLEDECFWESLFDEVDGVVEQFASCIFFLLGEPACVVGRPRLAWGACDVDVKVVEFWEDWACDDVCTNVCVGLCTAAMCVRIQCSASHANTCVESSF